MADCVRLPILIGMTKYTKDVLEPLVRSSYSYAQVIRKLGLKLSGGSQAFIKDKIILLGLNTSHFTGELWSKGLTKSDHVSIRNQAEKATIPPSTVLRLNTHYKGNILKRSLLSVGVKYICSVCGGEPVWCGKPITFHTDHINGNRRDNRQENLRFLCPNCHQQTPTWGNKNNANVAQRKEALV